MDTRNKRSGAVVDDILEEMKGKGQRAAKRDDAQLDNILAELGAAKKPASASKTAPAKPAARPSGASGTSPRAPAGQAAARPQTAAPGTKPAPQKSQPGAVSGAGPFAAAPKVPSLPQDDPAKPQRVTAPSALVAGKEEPVQPAGQKRAPQPEVFAPVAPEKRQLDDSTLVMERPSQRMNRINRGSVSKGHTATIMDIQPTHTMSIPRVGKAAAMDKVESGKYEEDEELLSWFGEDANLSKRERRRMEKERKKQEAADRKAAKRAEKYGEEQPAGDEEFPDLADLAPDRGAGAQRASAAGPVKEKALPNVSGLFGGQEAGSPRPAAQKAGEKARAGAQTAPAPKAPGAAAPTAKDGWVVLDATTGLDEVLTDPPAGQKTPGAKPQAAPAKPANRQQNTKPIAQAAVPRATQAAKPVQPQRPAPQGGQPVGQRLAPAHGAPAGGVAPKRPGAAPGTAGAAGMAKTVPFAAGAAASGAGQAAGGAPKPAPTTRPVAGQVKGKVSDTQTFEPEDEAKEEKIPTAAFTQEFETDHMAATQELEAKEGKSLFLDEMVDDQFRAFFGETIIMDKVDKEEIENTASTGTGKVRRRGKKSRTSLFTGEFAQLALDAEAEEELAAAAGDEPEIEEYSRPQDADKVQADLEKLKKSLTTRTVATGVIGVLLLWMGLHYGGILPLPFLAVEAHPLVFSVVYLGLVIAAIGINFTTVAAGLAGLVGEPTVDSAPALASLFALLQGVVVFTQLLGEKFPAVTLFGGLAALILAVNAFGKRLRARVILDNFHLTSGGFDHSAAYVVDGTQHELAHSITSGLEEPEPVLLVSRPTAFVKGFMRQSFSVRQSDHTGRILGWVLCGAGILAAVVSYVFTKDMTVAVSSAAAVLCIGAPFTSTLLSAVPSAIMQQNNSKVGAVVPGWSAIEDLGNVNVVMAGARDIFPPTSVTLKGIKTYEKERIDLAILYASSVLIEGCDTLREIFNGVIQGKSDMLYKVESLTREPGRGFTAWVENQRIVIGTREMLQRHAIEPPSIESELQYTTEGCLPVYLAVSGKLFAMFVVRYAPDPEVADTLESLVSSGLSLLVTSDDMNIDADLIERAYGLPAGVVKVLGEKELRILEPMTSYQAESAGVMSHIGTFTSFIGGMRSAAACALSEKWSGYVQLASVILAVLLCIGLVVSGGLASLSMGIILLYQVGWTLFVSIPMLLRF